jgi:hypothetical protein
MMTFEDIISNQLHDRKVAAMTYGPTAGKPQIIPGKESFKAISEAKGQPTEKAMELVLSEEFLRATGRPIKDDELTAILVFLKKASANRISALSTVWKARSQDDRHLYNTILQANGAPVRDHFGQIDPQLKDLDLKGPLNELLA